jgi:hypothetical protein
MITSAVTAAIVAVLSALGVKPSVGLVAGIAVVVKVIIVLTIAFIGWRTVQKERRSKKAAEAEVEAKPAD